MKDILEKKWDEALKELGTAGLPREKAREVLPGAVAFLCGAEQKERNQYLTEREVTLQRETVTQLQELQRQYPKIKGYIDFLFVEEKARLLRAEVEAEGGMETVRILNFIDLAQKIGAVNEWIPLGEGKWRRATETEGSTYLPKEAKEAGIHPFDFRKGQMKNRHYIPPRNAGPNTIALVTLLRERYEKADTEYRAAHPRPEKKVVPATNTTETQTDETQTEILGEQLPPPPPPPKQKKTTKKTVEREETEPKVVVKTKGGRGGAKADLRRKTNEALEES